MRKTATPARQLQERYRDRHDYLGRISSAALDLIKQGYILADDMPDIVERAARHFDWAVTHTRY